MSEQWADIGTYLRDAMTAAGIDSAKQLARRSRLSTAAVGRYLDGRRLPNMIDACALAHVLGIDATDLTVRITDAEWRTH